MPNAITDIQMTLLENARPGITTSELYKIARHAHPAASKKTIIHAAIGSLIAIADSDLERTLVMQNFAIRGRGAEDRAAFRLPSWPQFIWLSLSLPSIASCLERLGSVGHPGSFQPIFPRLFSSLAGRTASSVDLWPRRDAAYT